jgi:hypothetical protein
MVDLLGTIESKGVVCDEVLPSVGGIIACPRHGDVR